MLKTVASTIQQYNMLSPGDGVVVGLSGGADSVTLLSALHSLKEKLQLTIHAAHINHNLRGRASRKDERLARLLCEKLWVPFFVFQANVWEYARENKIGTEEAGRKLRYQYLHQCMAECNAHKIAVGHNQDDNAETILLNLFRGTGLKGLCGIPPVNGQIIRPLLEVSRKDIDAYVKENGLPFAKDKTNFSSNYSRNYIRNQITPKIRKHFGDKTSTTMAKNAMLLRADEEALSTITDWEVKRMMAYNFAEKKRMPSYVLESEVSLSINELLAQPLAIVRRIIRKTINNLRGEFGLEDIQSTHIEAIIDLAHGKSGREVSLPGFKARREYENLVLHKSQENTHPGYCYTLSTDSPVHIPPLTITLTLGPLGSKNIEKDSASTLSHCTQAFNYDKVRGPLEIRNRRPGDKITLSSGTKKLQDYFTDTKTPRNQRDTTPLLADGSNILWIMDKHNRVSVAYQPQDNQAICVINQERINPSCKSKKSSP